MNMKRLIALFTIAAVGLGACTSQRQGPEQPEKSRPLRFCISPIKASETRAQSFTDFDRSQSFGTTAFSLDESLTWKDDYASSASTDITGKEVAYKDNVWKIDGESYYWEDFEDKKLSFLSWTPYDLVSGCSSAVTGALSAGSYAGGLSISSTTKDFSYTGWTMTATPGYGFTKNSEGEYERNTVDGSVDLLLAKSPDCSEANSASGVLTQFTHQLCNVRVTAMILDDAPATGVLWQIKKVTISGIYTKANLLKAATPTVNTQIWGSHSDAVSYTVDYTASPLTPIVMQPKTETEVFPKTLMLPQTVYSTSTTREPKIEITFTDHNGDTRVMTGVLAKNTAGSLNAWLAGKSITYHVHVSTAENYIDFDASTDSWDYGSWTDIVVGN